MGIVYRHQKKEPLSIVEMDGNFAHLEERIKNLESKPVLAEGVANLNQEGDQVTFHGTFGSVLGKITLPKAFPNPRGKWQPNTSYRYLDWVHFERNIYSCIHPHTSQEFVTDKGKWVLVFEI